MIEYWGLGKWSKEKWGNNKTEIGIRSEKMEGGD